MRVSKILRNALEEYNWTRKQRSLSKVLSLSLLEYCLLDESSNVRTVLKFIRLNILLHQIRSACRDARRFQFLLRAYTLRRSRLRGTV